MAQLGRELDAVRRELYGSGETIPPEVWAQVLEYSIYDNVARMARVSTSFLNQVLPIIRTLYSDSEGAFTSGQHAKRFQGGKLDEIIIDCIFSRFGEKVAGIYIDRGETTFNVQNWEEKGKFGDFFFLCCRASRQSFSGKGKARPSLRFFNV